MLYMYVVLSLPNVSEGDFSGKKTSHYFPPMGQPNFLSRDKWQMPNGLDLHILHHMLRYANT